MIIVNLASYSPRNTQKNNQFSRISADQSATNKLAGSIINQNCGSNNRSNLFSTEVRQINSENSDNPRKLLIVAAVAALIVGIVLAFFSLFWPLWPYL